MNGHIYMEQTPIVVALLILSDLKRTDRFPNKAELYCNDSCRKISQS